MKYVTESDFYMVIQPAQIAQLIGNNGQGTMDLAVELAMDEVKSYLVQKYEIDAEYDLTGASRSLQVRMAVVDVALYILHSRIAPTNVPELRQKRYDNVIMWLKGCAKGMVTPSLQVIDITTTGSKFRFGSSPKQDNKY